jgi:hypothetical protein
MQRKRMDGRVVESSVSLMASNQPLRPGTTPATDRPFNPETIPGCELLERTIARIETEFGGFGSPPSASRRLAQGLDDRHATEDPSVTNVRQTQ